MLILLFDMQTYSEILPVVNVTVTEITSRYLRAFIKVNINQGVQINKFLVINMYFFSITKIVEFYLDCFFF